jgi:hypothetical protein
MRAQQPMQRAFQCKRLRTLPHLHLRIGRVGLTLARLHDLFPAPRDVEREQITGMNVAAKLCLSRNAFESVIQSDGKASTIRTQIARSGLVRSPGGGGGGAPGNSGEPRSSALFLPIFATDGHPLGCSRRDKLTPCANE